MNRKRTRKEKTTKKQNKKLEEQEKLFLESER